MSMLFFDRERTSHGLSIGPIQHCGYVLLINEDKKQPNCSAVTAIINGYVRIIVYTHKNIKKGE
jgi:SET domain-containing protein